MRGRREFFRQLVDFLEQCKAIARFVACNLIVRYTFCPDINDDLAALAGLGVYLYFVTVAGRGAHNQGPAGAGSRIGVTPVGDYGIVRLDLEQDTVATQRVFG